MSLHILNMLFYLGMLGLLIAKGDGGLNIRVNPRIVMKGQSVWLTCRVTPDKRNRKLLFGIAGSEREGSERQLGGSSAPITWGPIEFKHIPCDAGPAYCIVERQGERPLQVMETIQVAGCDAR